MCYFCGENFTGDKIYRTSVCHKCGKDLHICLNCRFYSPGAHYDCVENVDECVNDKEKANFCEYFVYADRKGKNSNSKSEQAKKAFMSLFGE